MEKTQDRVVFSGLAELGAVRNIVTAFGKWASEDMGDSFTPEAQEQLDNTVRAIDDTQSMITYMRASTRIDAEDRLSFGPPYDYIIEMSVAMLEQRPDLLEPYLTPDEFLEAQTFFPPTQAET